MNDPAALVISAIVGVGIGVAAYLFRDAYARALDLIDADLREKLRVMRMPAHNLRTYLKAWTALIVLVVLQIKAKRFHPSLYWATIIASTTAGTTLADFADRSLGIGYPGGSILLAACLATSLIVWRTTLGTISVKSVETPKAEIFYWITITFSQTLGTALGDWVADRPGVGYLGGAVVFSIPLLILASLYFWTKASRVALFWGAFILTRPLGATVGDFLDKPIAKGGLDLSRPLATLVLAVFIAGCLVLFQERASEHAH